MWEGTKESHWIKGFANHQVTFSIPQLDVDPPPHPILPSAVGPPAAATTLLLEYGQSGSSRLTVGPSSLLVYSSSGRGRAPPPEDTHGIHLSCDAPHRAAPTGHNLPPKQ